MSELVYVSLETITCYSCSAVFGMTSSHYRNRKNDHGTFYCVACGKGQYFPGQSEAEKLRDEIARKARRIETLETDKDQLKKSLRAEKGQKTKLRKKMDRVANGVCPCCMRSFENLQRHMKTKHPEEIKKKVTK